MSSFHWVANCRLKVGRDEYRDEGEYTPEAHQWRDPDLWERAGKIRKVPGPPPGMPGGDGCHVHDLHDGKCSKCEFVAPVETKTEPEPTPKDEDPVADEILAAAVEVLGDDAVTSPELESTPEPEPDPQPEPETKQEPATVPTADSEPEPDQGDGQGDGSDPDEADEDDSEEEYEPHTKSELTRMRKADLQALALEWDLVVGEATKADIIHAIMEAQEEQ